MRNNYDLGRELYIKYSDGSYVYHVINAAGCPYTTIETPQGLEFFSCPREEEKDMLEFFESDKNITRVWQADDTE